VKARNESVKDCIKRETANYLKIAREGKRNYRTLKKRDITERKEEQKTDKHKRPKGAPGGRELGY